MLDINKTRTNLHIFPLKQKCDSIAIVQAAAEKNGITSTSATNALRKTAAAAADEHMKSTAKKYVQNNQATSKKEQTHTHSNPVRAANKNFFLVPAFKDQNFLKHECELARAQVLLPKYDEPKEDRNSNKSSTLDCTHNKQSSLPRLEAGGGGMRYSERNSCSNGNTTTATATATTTSSATFQRVSGHTFNQYNTVPKTAASTTSSAAFGIASAFGPISSAVTSNANKINNRQVVKPFIHRTIPTTAINAANLVRVAANKENNNTSEVKNSGSESVTVNSMRHHLCKKESLENEQDDIKYIDSDDAGASPSPVVGDENRKQGNVNSDTRSSKILSPSAAGAAAAISSIANARARPKSTIIPSANDHILSKVNIYKYANGGLRSGTVTDTSTVKRNESKQYGIDTKSIKASIDKFNNYSEQKHLPLTTVMLRSHTNSGSTSNLQHHRHSSDFDNCNLRLTNNSGGSLTRTPNRVITSLHSPISIPSTTLRTPISNCGTSNRLLSRTATATAASSASSSKLTTTLSSHTKPDSLLTRIIDRTATTTNTVTTITTSSSHLMKEMGSSPATATAYSSPVTTTTTTTAPTTTIATLRDSKSASPHVGDNHHKDATKAHTNAVVDGKKRIDPSSLYDSEDSSAVRSITSRSAVPSASTSLATSSRYWDRDGRRISATSQYKTADDTSKSSDEKKEGLCGLRNIGNTCFMNSVIQCLSHTSELTKFLRTYSGTKTSSSTKDQHILQEFAKLIREMWTSSVHSVTPMDLKRAFSTKHRMYSDYNQQDAQEFLRFFLDSLHSAMNTGVKGEPLKIDDNLSDNKKADLTWEWYSRHENSLIREMFVGQLKSTLKCTICGNTSVTFDPFWDLSVPLLSSSRCKLEACLDLFIREEILDGDEMPTCSKCQTRRKCTKSFTIQRFPKYLVIHLKRFSETRWSKLTSIVEFPTTERELNMGPYGSNSNNNVYYSLYAISNHMGSTAGGHYVALCKHPYTKQWHEFNDNIVSDALAENHLVSSSAYILFYERS